MKRFLYLGLLGLLMLSLFGLQVQAGALSALSTTQVNELEDDDWEIKVAGAGTQVLAGDLLLAILQVGNVNYLNGPFDGSLNGSVTSANGPTFTPSTDAFTGVSLIKVATVAVSGGQAGYTFTAPTPAEWATYTGLAAVDVGTMLVLFDDPPSAPDPHVDPTGSVASGVGTAANGTRLWELGFTGAAGAPVSPEFWSAISGVAFGSGDDPTDITKITDLTFFAALNVLDTNGAPEIVKHNALGDPDLAGTNSAKFTGPVALQLQGNIDTGTVGAFQIKTDTNLYLGPIVPEPTSLLVFGGLAGVGALFGARRRRKCNLA